MESTKELESFIKIEQKDLQIKFSQIYKNLDALDIPTNYALDKSGYDDLLDGNITISTLTKKILQKRDVDVNKDSIDQEQLTKAKAYASYILEKKSKSTFDTKDIKLTIDTFLENHPFAKKIQKTLKKTEQIIVSLIHNSGDAQSQIAKLYTFANKCEMNPHSFIALSKLHYHNTELVEETPLHLSMHEFIELQKDLTAGSGYIKQTTSHQLANTLTNTGYTLQLEDEKKLLIQQIEDLKNTLEKTYQEAKKSVDKNISLTNENLSLHNTNKTLEKKYNTSNKKVSDLENENKKLSDTLSSITGSENSAEALDEISKLRDIIKKSNDENKKMSTELTLLKDENKSLISEKNEHIQKVQDLLTKYTGIESIIKEIEEDVQYIGSQTGFLQFIGKILTKQYRKNINNLSVKNTIEEQLVHLWSGFGIPTVGLDTGGLGALSKDDKKLTSILADAINKYQHIIISDEHDSCNAMQNIFGMTNLFRENTYITSMYDPSKKNKLSYNDMIQGYVDTIEYVDYMVLACGQKDTDLDTAISDIIASRKNDIIRHIGLKDPSIQDIERIQKILKNDKNKNKKGNNPLIAMVQIEMHPFLSYADIEEKMQLIRYCRETMIPLSFYNIFDDTSKKHNQKTIDVLNNIGAKIGCSRQDVALIYALQIGGIGASILIDTVNSEYISTIEKYKEGKIQISPKQIQEIFDTTKKTKDSNKNNQPKVTQQSQQHSNSDIQQTSINTTGEENREELIDADDLDNELSENKSGEELNSNVVNNPFADTMKTILDSNNHIIIQIPGGAKIPLYNSSQLKNIDGYCKDFGAKTITQDPNSKNTFILS